MSILELSDADKVLAVEELEQIPRRIVIILDVLEPKNQVQLDCIIDLGYHIDVFVTHLIPSINFASACCTVSQVNGGFFSRCRQFFGYFFRNFRVIKHIEIYPGGRFSCIYLILAKLFSISTICVERGDILYYHKNGYNRTTRFSMSICYRWSDLIWYREPYMEKDLIAAGSRELFFLHNAVESREQLGPPDAGEVRGITFLWVNRIIPERKSQWLVDILKAPEFSDAQSFFCGLLGRRSMYPDEENYIRKAGVSHIHVVDYCDPLAFYQNAKFFLLPADVVFANFALLEAMSHGVVPIVSDVMGANRIVQHGENGFCVSHDKEAFRTAMNTAVSLSNEEYERLSKAARETIRRVFSKPAFKEELKHLYDKVGTKH